MRPLTLLLLVTLCGARGSRAVPEPPAPTPAAGVRDPSPEVCPCTPPMVCRCIRICIVQNGRLREVPVVFNPATGDTLTEDGLPFSSLAPLTGEYASVAWWYVKGDPITFRGRSFVRYDRPRVLGINEITKVGEYRGVGMYADAGDTVSVPRYLYLPTRLGCEFQPYVVDSLASGNR